MRVPVRVPSPLYSYTGGKADVWAEGATLGEVLSDLDRRYPGLKFRIVDEQDRVRPHVLIYVGGEKATAMSAPASGEVLIIAALSGG